MKKFLRFGAALFVLSASFSIVLHAGHLDADHLKNSPSHQCGFCKTVTNAAVPVAASYEPTFVKSDFLPILKYAVLSARLLSGEDPRGPPHAQPSLSF